MPEWIDSWFWGLALDGASLSAAWLLGCRKRIGWLVTFTSMLVLWPAYAVTHDQWGFFPGIVAHAVIAAWGWVQWSKTKQGVAPTDGH